MDNHAPSTPQDPALYPLAALTPSALRVAVRYLRRPVLRKAFIILVVLALLGGIPATILYALVRIGDKKS